MIKRTLLIASFLIGNPLIFYTVQAQKVQKRKPASVAYSRQDRLQAEFRVLVHRAMKQLKEQYIGSVLVEKKFDVHMDKYLQAHIGQNVYERAKDSLRTILIANYIDKFKIKDAGEIDNLVQALFMEKSSTRGSKEPPIIETLNAIKKDPSKSTKDQEAAVIEELERLLLSTWDLEVVSLMHKYQINIISNPKTVPGTAVLPAPKKN